MRVVGNSLLAQLVLLLASPIGLAGELRVAAWNLEHLDDSDGDGCVGRNSADHAALARRIQELNADVVAFLEVENAAAAHPVFPAIGLAHRDVPAASYGAKPGMLGQAGGPSRSSGDGFRHTQGLRVSA